MAMNNTGRWKMLDNVDLSQKLSKKEFKAAADDKALKLGALQRQARELGIPVMVVFEGWDAAGKGTLINNLIMPLDPRGFVIHNVKDPNEEELMRPFLWRFWCKAPANGKVAIYDNSWYKSVIDGAALRVDSPEITQGDLQDIVSFERQLADGGAILIKFFLHISKKEQAARFDKLLERKATAWRVNEDDIVQHKLFKRFLKAADEALVATDTDFAPWTVVEATDERFATMKVFDRVIEVMEAAVQSRQAAKPAEAAPVQSAKPVKAAAVAKPAPATPVASILDKLDLTLSVSREDYQEALKKKQKRLRELEYEIYRHRVPVVLAFEGSDAAGKGGNIKRLTQNLDPRGYEVVPVGAPNDIELAHHYLWRFWTQMPKAGHITIFDRTWYGRVLVERVEGFCSEADWKRAYHEINEMERHMANFGAVVLKFWLQISKEEQLKRFNERQSIPAKQWKITDEDWRNRDKWDAYRVAVEEAIFRCGTQAAPWTIVESDCKLYARLKVLDTVIDAIEARLKQL